MDFPISNLNKICAIFSGICGTVYTGFLYVTVWLKIGRSQLCRIELQGRGNLLDP